MKEKITYLCDTNLHTLLARVSKLYDREDPPRLVNVFYDGVAVLEWRRDV